MCGTSDAVRCHSLDTENTIFWYFYIPGALLPTAKKIVQNSSITVQYNTVQ
jgi:hypothetical protein